MENSKTPQPKVVAGGVAGAAVIVLVWAAGQLNVELPPEVAAALVSVTSFVASYVKSN